MADSGVCESETMPCGYNSVLREQTCSTKRFACVRHVVVLPPGQNRITIIIAVIAGDEWWSSNFSSIQIYTYET